MRPRAFHLLVHCPLLISFAASCGPSDAARDRSAGLDGAPQSEAGPTGDHWVQDERLREVMRNITEHAGRRPAGVPDDPESATSPEARAESEAAFRDAVALADGLALAARRIPRSVADHPMSEEERGGFNAEARRLRDQAMRLRRAARARRVQTMQRALDAISSTCVSCHSRYRDFTGELGAIKAGLD